LASLNPFTGHEDRLAIDSHGWAALVAPRNLLFDTGYYDDGDPSFAVERGFVASSAVYKLLGAEDHFRLDYREGWHDPITPARYERNIDWFDACFGRGTASRDKFPQNYLHRFDWNAWQAKLTATEKANPFATPKPQDDADRVARIRWMLGQTPETSFHGKYTFYTQQESEMCAHDRWQAPNTARVPVSFGHNVHGNLFYSTSRTTPAPVVIWLHPYSYGLGYNEAYGVEDTTVYYRLAQAGYAVLAFDQVGFGLRLLEGRDFYQNHPKWSRLGRMVDDVRAAVDFIADGKGSSPGALPKIDKTQIHVLGYSLGGMVGLYSAALDTRIRSVASFAGFTPMRTDTAQKPTGGIRQLWEQRALLPMLGLFEGRESQIPYDVDDVISLVAPRPCLIYSPVQDRFADSDDVKKCVEQASKAYERAGSRNNLHFLTPNDISRFQREQQEQYLRWLSSISR
jgi:pimeloyl-ACP methyl ester carboxylesterase